MSTPTSQTPKEEKIYNLTVELEKAKRNKKDVMRAHNDNIKRLNDEIKEILKDAEAIA